MNKVRVFEWGAKITPLLPTWLGNSLCALIGTLMYLFATTKRQAVLDNLSHVLPDHPLSNRKRIARRIMQSSMRNYYDLLRTYKIPPDKLGKMVEVRGIPEMKAVTARNGGGGTLVYSGHLGSFSLSAQVASYNDVDFFLVVEPIKPPELFEVTRHLREVDRRTHTISIATMEVREIFRSLKVEDSMTCMAIDRDVTGQGTPLTFFGAKANLPTGVAEIALRTKATVMPIHVYRKGKQYHIDLWYEQAFVAESTGDKTADVARISQQMLAQVEKMILKTPDQWAVLQPIWGSGGEGQGSGEIQD